MSFADKYNKNRLFDFNTDGFEYVGLDDLYNQNGEGRVYPIRAIYINTKGKFGDSPVFATDDCFVNIPSHMCDTVQEILDDAEAVKDINNGKVGFTIYKYYQRTYKRDCFNVKFVDVL